MFAVIDVWFACRLHQGSPGATPLPASGGIGAQPAALVDAFAVLDAAIGEEVVDG